MWGSWGLRLSSGSSRRISGGFLRGYWLGDPLWLWWELVTSHVIVDMDLVVVSSSCELGSLLASGAWFGSIGVGGDCICGGCVKGFVTDMPFQTVGGSIHSSNCHLGRGIPLGDGVPLGSTVIPLGDSVIALRDGVSSACAEALVRVRHGWHLSTVGWAQ